MKTPAWRAAVAAAGLIVAAVAGAGAQTPAGTAPAGAAPLNIVAFGDSLTAGLGLMASEAFPAQLQRALEARGIAATVANAGVSGDTASAGVSRLDWAVPETADAVIVELGANDALRGVDPAVTRAALDTVLRRLRDRHIPILLCGMLAPPNLGSEYGRAFNAIYPELAAADGAILYPFFLDGVAADPALNQPDGMHPTAAGVAVIVKRILPQVEALVARARPAR